MLTQLSDYAVVRLLIDLGRAVGIPVTAEGVETAEQLRALSDAGCGLAQGYFLSRPAERRAITSWIAGYAREAAA
jgi:EAL domain-containing protein (putative c-di-GMP-specific phosphodiesterase class I)